MGKTVTPSPRIVIRPFASADAESVAELLGGSSEEYTRHFHPFEFRAPVIEAMVASAVLDQWFVLEVFDRGATSIAGFYMLRGVDEGFPDPMYGIFIAERYSGRGLARLTLAHAEAQCRLNGWLHLRLKVSPKNIRAYRLYESWGFTFERVDTRDPEHMVLLRDLSK